MSTKQKPDIAVLLTIYKPGDEVKTTLASLKAQTTPFKLYLVDDGSPYAVDYETLTAGLDCQIERLPKNVGRTAALNVGLRQILSNDHAYVAIIDNADTAHPERLARQKTFLETHSDISIVSTWVRYTYQSTGRVHVAQLPESWQACAKLLRYNAPITHTAMMARAEAFRRVNLYSEAYPSAEDYAFEMMANAKGMRMANIPEILMDTLEMHESISGGRRNEQIKSRLKLQITYADWLNPHTWAGIARTMILMVAPVGLLRSLKSALKG